MLQEKEPRDYVVAPGGAHPGRARFQLAFDSVGLSYRDFVITDETLFRPADVALLLGDASKARAQLGWVPRYSFAALIEEMVQAELEICRGSPKPMGSRAA
jgi:GDPmannose 4,6-dehydratase